MEFNPVDIIIHLINIIVLYLILRTLLYKPVHNFMKNRADRIAASMADAESKLAEAGSVKDKYDDMMKSAEDDASERGTEIVKKADADAALIVESANAEAKKILADAKLKADAESARRLKEMRGEIGDLAVDIAGKILSREVNGADNRAIADKFFAEGREPDGR